MLSFANVFAPSPPPSPTRAGSRTRSNSYAPSPKLEQAPFSPRHHRHARTLSLGPFSTSIPANAAGRARLARSLLWVVGLFVAAWVVLQRGQQWWSQTPLQELSRWSTDHSHTHVQREIEVDETMQGHGYPMSRALERTVALQQTAIDDAAHPVPTAGQQNKLRSRAHHQPAAVKHHAVVHRSISSPSTPTVALTPSQELASLLHFLVSTPQGTLPPLTVYSPAETPLSPEWVLDFDLGPAGAKRDAKMKAFESEVWEGVGKLVIVGRENDVWMKEVTRLLKEYRVDPSNVNSVDLGQRADAATLSPLLKRLLAREANMHIILAGTSIGGYDDLKSLHEAGKLQGMLDSAGIKIMPVPKVVKKRAKMAHKK